MKKRVLACILAAALLTTGIPGGQAAMAQSLTETGTEMATEEVNPENISEETEAASVTETEAQTSTETETEDVAGGSESQATVTEETEGHSASRRNHIGRGCGGRHCPPPPRAGSDKFSSLRASKT